MKSVWIISKHPSVSESSEEALKAKFQNCALLQSASCSAQLSWWGVCMCVNVYSFKWKPVGFMPPVHVTVSDVGTVNSFLARLQRERWLAVALSTDSASTGMTKQTESPVTLEGETHTHTHARCVSHTHFLSFFFCSCTSPSPLPWERWVMNFSKTVQQRYHQFHLNVAKTIFCGFCF